MIFTQIYIWSVILTNSGKPTTRSGYHVEGVRCGSIEHCEVFEIVSSLDHKDDVDANNQVEREKERLVVLPIACCKGVGKLLLEGLVPRFSS